MSKVVIDPQALQRFKVIQPFLENGVPLPELVQGHDMSLRTLRRWVSCYRNKGLEGLSRKTRNDKGAHRQVSSQLLQLIEALTIEKPPRSIATIHRLVCETAKEHSETIPSYETVYAIVKSIDPALLMLAHSGSKQYQQSYDLLYRQEAKSPNEVWQADHTLLDIWILDEKEQPARPWLTIILDDFSRVVAGYYLSFEAPSALQTALALRQAIWRKSDTLWQVCGIPETLYTDHGSDFTSQHIEQVCIDLKIQLVFSTVGKPRGRGKVERFFGTINQLLLSTLSGYSPAGSAPSKPSITLDVLDHAIKKFLIEQYHPTPHSSTKIEPIERWKNQVFLPHLPESLESLDLLLIHVAKARQVHRDGIRFQNLRYIDVALAAYVGEPVTIRYDPRDMAEIRVFYKNNFLCRAVCQELSGETVSLKDIIRARKTRQRDLRNTIAQRKSLLDQILKSPQIVNSEGLDKKDGSLPSPKETVITKKIKRYKTDD